MIVSYTSLHIRQLEEEIEGNTEGVLVPAEVRAEIGTRKIDELSVCRELR